MAKQPVTCVACSGTFLCLPYEIWRAKKFKRALLCSKKCITAWRLTSEKGKEYARAVHEQREPPCTKAEIDAYESRYRSFMLLRADVATLRKFLNAQNTGTDWGGSTKVSMAEAYANKSRFGQLKPAITDEDVEELTRLYGARE